MRTLYIHGFIYTADEEWTFYNDGALLVENDLIKWIGDFSAWKEDSTRTELHPDSRVDVSGKVIFPGLINAHTHGGTSTLRGLYDAGDLFEWAKILSPFTSYLNEDDLRLGCYLAVMEQVATGTTCACDCTRYGVGIFARVATEIGARSISGALVNSSELRPDGLSNWPAALQETQEAMKELAGSERNRFFLGAHSPYNCTSKRLLEVKREAERLGLHFNIHVSENRKEVDLLERKYGTRPVLWLDQLGILDNTVLIDHAVWLDEQEIEVLQRRGVSVAHCPISNAKLASGIAPIPKYLQSGITVGLGTDGNLSNNTLDMFQEMKFAVLLQRAHRLDGHALETREVIRMATLGSAKAVGWEKEIGSLSLGKQADFIILQLPVPRRFTAGWVESDLVFSAGRLVVESVVVAGNLIYQDGHFTQFDYETILEEIQERYTNIPVNRP